MGGGHYPPYGYLLEKTVSKPAVPSMPAARPNPNHRPKGRGTERNARNCREIGVAFCTDRMAIATTSNAGITTSRNLVIASLGNLATDTELIPTPYYLEDICWCFKAIKPPPVGRGLTTFIFSV